MQQTRTASLSQVTTALLCLALYAAPPATAQEAAAPPEFFWSAAESKRVAFLARAIRRGDDGYWTHAKAGLQVSTSISARLAAEAVCYVEDMIKGFPRALGLNLPPRAAQVRLVFHKTREQLAGVTGDGG